LEKIWKKKMEKINGKNKWWQGKKKIEKEKNLFV
jgi:hypothetical protein